MSRTVLVVPSPVTSSCAVLARAIRDAVGDWICCEHEQPLKTKILQYDCEWVHDVMVFMKRLSEKNTPTFQRLRNCERNHGGENEYHLMKQNIPVLRDLHIACTRDQPAEQVSHR